VSVSGNIVSINFPGGVLPNLSMRYSQDVKVDINPGIDASVYGGTYGGSSTPTVSGHVEVEVRLESGETLRARTNITFRAVPQ
jgi:type V secretory pathway adhesin AidA